MGKSIKLILILSVISLLSGAVLSLVYSITSPTMEAVALENQQKSIFEVLPGIESYREYKNDESMLIYEGLSKEGNVIGLAYVAEGAGFQGRIKLMIGMDIKSKRITEYKVLEHQETPGLGAKINEEGFKQQFSQKPWTEPFKVKDDIEAITGATISSRAVTELITKSLDEVLQIVGSDEQ